MSLSSSFNILDTAFAAFATQSSTIATNIANANTPGYTRQAANLTTTDYGGVSVISVTRNADDALSAQADLAASEAASQSAISQGLTTLAQTVSDSSQATSTGALQNGNSPAALLGNLNSALSVFQSSPSSVPSAQAAVNAAQALTSSINAGAQAVQSVRSNADQQIAAAVTNVNAMLNQFQTVNNSIVLAINHGSNVSLLEDQRDALVSKISQQIGVTTSINTNGSMSIYSDSGVALFDNTPFQLDFNAAGTLGPNAVGAQVTVNGTPITGAGSNMAIHTGAIAGLVQLRDTIAPQYQSQLDQIAGNLITAFQETDQSTTNTGLPALPGLFTTPGATSVPSSSNWTGLANAITVNPNVQSSQGGNPFLLRDGGISDTADTNYTYNTTGAVGYTGRLQGLISALSAQMPFSANAGLGTSTSLTDYASSSVSWLQAANQQATANSTYQQSLLTQAQSALSNATGVNLDSELTNMLTIESSYTATAKLLTTANNMLHTLVSAI